MTRRYLTNLKNNQRDLVKEAIQQSGRTDLHIDLDPMPGHPDERAYLQVRESMFGSYFSVYLEGHNTSDCSDFWSVYYDLSKTPYWKTYFELCKDLNDF